jgi:ABC-type transporter Mla maintaining outer membrane lipid asymmetry ATPase subunit MlaF
MSDPAPAAIIRFEKLSLEMEGHVYLRDADLTVYEGESLVVAGLPGCGKSLVLRLILGLPGADDDEVHLEGDVTVNGQSVLDMPLSDLQRLRRRMGSVMRDGGLIENMDIRGNVSLPLNYHHRGIMSVAEIEGRCDDLLRDMGLLELAATGVRPVSINREQRLYVSLARAFINEPFVLLMDDPAAGFSPGSAYRLKRFFFHYRPEFPTHPSNQVHTGRPLTRISTTSDLGRYIDFGDRFVVLSDQKLRVIGDRVAIAASTEQDVLQLLGPEVRADSTSLAEETASDLIERAADVATPSGRQEAI